LLGVESLAVEKKVSIELAWTPAEKHFRTSSAVMPGSARLNRFTTGVKLGAVAAIAPTFRS
jgi:hypothetical protein